VVLRKFREEDEEQFAQVMFKVSSKLLIKNTFSIKSINARTGFWQVYVEAAKRKISKMQKYIKGFM
jgi:hypothetical protein